MAGEAQIQQQARLRAATGEAADKGGVAVGGGVTEAKRVIDRAKVLREAVHKKAEESPAQTLIEAMAAKDKGKPQVVDQAIDQNIGTTIDSAGKKILTSSEFDRKLNAEIANQVIKEILGGKVLTATEWGDARYKPLKAGLDQLIDASAFSYLPSADRLTFYNALLADKGFMQSIIDRYDEVSKTTISDDVTEAKRRAEEADRKFKIKKVDKESIDSDLSDAEKDKKSFEDKLIPTSKGSRLAALKAKPLDIDLRSRNLELAQLQDRIAKINAGKISGVTDTTAETTRQGVLLSEIGPIEAEIRERDGLIAAENALPQKIKDLKAEQARLDLEFDAVSSDKRAADSAYSSAILKRGEAEARFVSDLENVIRDGIAKKLDANLAEVDAAAKTQLEKDIQEETDEFGRKLGEFAKTRYWSDRDPSDIKWYSRDKSRKIEDKGLAHEDIAMLLKNGSSPDSLVRLFAKKYAAESLKAKGGTPTQDQIEAETTRIMKDNPDMVTKWGGKMAEQAMGIYLRTGGKLTNTERQYLADQDWGLALIQKGIESNAAVKEAEQKWKESGYLKGGGLVEWIKHNKGKSALIAALIAMLLALAFGAGGGFAPGAVNSALSGIGPFFEAAGANAAAFAFAK